MKGQNNCKEKLKVFVVVFFCVFFVILCCFSINSLLDTDICSSKSKKVPTHKHVQEDTYTSTQIKRFKYTLAQYRRVKHIQILTYFKYPQGLK